MSTNKISDKEPFYHGTKADLQVDDLLTARIGSNYKTGVIMNHIYFTALANGAGLAAALAKGDGRERVYIVEPTGRFEMIRTSQIKNSLAINTLVSRSITIENRWQSNRLGEANT